MKGHAQAVGGWLFPRRLLPGRIRERLTHERRITSLAVLLLFAGVVALSACTHPMKYKPEYLDIPALAPAPKLNGKCIIYTTGRDDGYVFQGPPGSALGAAHKIKIPLGLITKNAAIRLFDDVCSEVSTADNLDEGDYDIAIYPKPIGFEYYFIERGVLGLIVTPQIAVALQMDVFNVEQDLVFSKAYESGIVNGKNIYVTMTGWENVNVAAHETIVKLLSAAAMEIVSTLDE